MIGQNGTISKIFRVICCIAVMIMIGYWLYKFEIEDRDIGVVDYEMLEKAEIEYPYFSICLHNPFVEQELIKIENNSTIYLNKNSYLKYLKGEFYEAKIAKDIKYDNVTINLDDYFLYAIFQLRNESSVRFISSKKRFNHQITFNGFYRNGIFVKCFAPDILKTDFPNLKSFEIYYNSNALLTDLSITKMGVQSVLFNIHYPEHFLLEVNRGNGILSDLLRHGKTGGTRLSITDIEFIKRRRNRNHDCLENWKEFDSLVLERHIETFRCRPPYIQLPKHFIGIRNNFSLCDSMKQIKESKYDFSKARLAYYPKACQRISRLNYYRKTYVSQRMWRITILYPEEVKIITQSKEVDVHSLIGNIGGYIGLFLGWALIQIPDLIVFVYNFLRQFGKNSNQSRVGPRTKIQEEFENKVESRNIDHEIDRIKNSNIFASQEQQKEELKSNANLQERQDRMDDHLKQLEKDILLFKEYFKGYPGILKL